MKPTVEFKHTNEWSVDEPYTAWKFTVEYSIRTVREGSGEVRLDPELDLNTLELVKTVNYCNKSAAEVACTFEYRKQILEWITLKLLNNYEGLCKSVEMKCLKQERELAGV